MAETIVPDPPGERLRARITRLVGAVEIGRATAPQVTAHIEQAVNDSLLDLAGEAWRTEHAREMDTIRAGLEPYLVHRLITRTDTRDAVRMLLDYVDLRAGPPGFMGNRS